MDRLSGQAAPGIFAGTAYQLILVGVNQSQTEEGQRLFLDSLLCQCAVFARLLTGEQAFRIYLDGCRISILMPSLKNPCTECIETELLPLRYNLVCEYGQASSWRIFGSGTLQLIQTIGNRIAFVDAA